MTGTENPPLQPMPERSGEIDVGALWTALKLRKWWIFLPTLLAAGGAAAFVNIVTARFTSEARILLESRETSFTRPSFERDGGAGTAATFDSEGVQSQVQVITSFDISRAAIKKLGLVGNSEFDPAESGLGPLARMLVMAGLQTSPADRTPENRVLETYYDRLTVFPVGKSRVVAIEFSSRDADLSARAANTIAAIYLETVQAAKKDTARSAGSWLTAAIDPLRSRLAEAEAKVEAFRSQVGLIVSTNNATIVQQQLAEMSTQLSSARDAKTQAEVKAKIIRESLRGGRVFEISEVVNNETIRRLIEQRGGIKTQIARDLRTLLPAHPQIKALEAQLADVEAQIRSAAERQVRAMENDARVAAARVDTLVAALDEQKKGVTRANSDEVQLRALEREAKSLREQLESYLAKRTEALARDAENAAPADARIISTAIVPTRQSFPKKLPIILVATLCAFGVSTALVAAREIASGRAHSQDALQSADAAMTPQPVALATSAAKPASDEPPQNPTLLAEIAKRVAAERTREGALRLLLVGHDRQSTEAPYGLARGLAESGRTILVSLQPEEGATEAPAGIVDLAAGKASFMEAITRDPETRLHRIAFGRGDSAELMNHKVAFGLVIDALAETYDNVVLACSGEVADEIAKLAASVAESAIIVAAGDEPDERVGKSFMRFEAFSGREPYVLMLGRVAEPPTREAA